MPTPSEYATKFVVPIFRDFDTIHGIAKSISPNNTRPHLATFARQPWINLLPTPGTQGQFVLDCQNAGLPDPTGKFDLTGLYFFDFFCYFANISAASNLLSLLGLIADTNPTSKPGGPYFDYPEESLMPLVFEDIINGSGDIMFRNLLSNQLNGYEIPWSGQLDTTMRPLVKRQLLDVVSLLLGYEVD